MMSVFGFIVVLTTIQYGCAGFPSTAVIAGTTMTPTTSPTTTTPKPAVCPYSSCTCTGVLVDCSGKGFTRIPTLSRSYVPGEFTQVDLSNNRFSTISARDLPANITTLDLSDTPIRSIAPDAFSKFSETLKELRFSNAQFEQLPTALKSLNELEMLKVSGVNITDWNLPVIYHLAFSLKVVDFSDTSMTQWPAFTRYFVFLHELDLSYNPIKSIPLKVLEEWRNQLTVLKLSNTNLTDASFAIQLKMLENLDLSGNSLGNHQKLSYDLIPLSSTLKEIDLSFNRLTATPRLIDFKALTSLKLSDNVLESSDVAAFPITLKTLNLDNNYFPELPDGVTSLKYLKTLSIGNNKIKVLSGEQFPIGSSALVDLDVSGNPILTVTRHAFDSLRYLQKLNMASTTITALPLALAQLRNIKELHLENNPRLLCRCEEKSLSVWYGQRKSQIVVTGECGYESITEFVERFMTNCF